MIRIHELDFQHQSILHNIASVHQDEYKRRLSVDIVRLQGDKTVLESQASEQESVIERISSEREGLLRAIHEATRDAEEKDAKAKRYAENLAKLQVRNVVVSAHTNSKNICRPS